MIIKKYKINLIFEITENADDGLFFLSKIGHLLSMQTKF